MVSDLAVEAQGIIAKAVYPRLADAGMVLADKLGEVSKVCAGDVAVVIRQDATAILCESELGNIWLRAFYGDMNVHRLTVFSRPEEDDEFPKGKDLRLFGCLCGLTRQ